MHQNDRQSFKRSHNDQRRSGSRSLREWLMYLEAILIGAATFGPLVMMLWSLIKKLF